MSNYTIKVCLNVLAIVLFVSCTNKNRKPQESNTTNVAKGDIISIPEILKNDKIAGDVLSDLKYIELKGYKNKENRLNSKNVKLIGDRIYVFDSKINELYCYDFQGMEDYYIDFDKYRIKNNEELKISSFFINNGKLKVVDASKALFITFNRTNLVAIKEFSTWALEVEAFNNDSLIAFQGYVNERFGAPYYFIKTDTNLVVKNKHLKVPSIEIRASEKIGTVQNHIFHTDRITNLLRDQDNSIYKYPDFTAPAYKVDFGIHNINLLSATSLDLPSPSMYGYARIQGFWEADKHIMISYSFQGELGYVIHNKESKKIYNNYRINNLNDMALFGVLGVHKDSFFTLVTNDQIRELLKVKSDNRGFLKSYLEKREPTSSNPVLVFFKLRNI